MHSSAGDRGRGEKQSRVRGTGEGSFCRTLREDVQQSGDVSTGKGFFLSSLPSFPPCFLFFSLSPVVPRLSFCLPSRPHVPLGHPGELGEDHFLPQDAVSSFLKTRGSRVSERQLECEVQTPRPLSGPMMAVYVFLGFYSHREIC